MSQPTTITLSPQLVSQLEPVAAQTHESIESIVNAAIAEYLRTQQRRRLRASLAHQYGELAATWHELADDVSDERWLTVENEALSKFEKSLDD